MKPSRAVVCGIYGVIAVVALVATWSQNVAFMLHEPGGGAFATMVDQLSANFAVRSFTVDLLLLTLAACFLMVFEARRTGVKYVWLYVLGGLLVAISVAFPLFLIARERALADGDEPQLGAVDTALLGLLSVTLLAGVLWVSVR